LNKEVNVDDLVSAEVVHFKSFDGKEIPPFIISHLLHQKTTKCLHCFGYMVARADNPELVFPIAYSIWLIMGMHACGKTIAQQRLW